MKNQVILSTIILFFEFPLFAQISAGEVPEGSSTFDPGISMVNDETKTEIIESFDINCDDSDDFELVLYHGSIEVDGVSTVRIRSLNEGLEMCMNGVGFSGRPKYYNYSEEINCSGEYDWISDTTYYLGSFGGFTNLPPSLIDDLYVAFRIDAGTENEMTGWINLSFDLQYENNASAVTAEIHEVLILCESNSSDSEISLEELIIFPNPVENGRFSIQGVDPGFSVCLYTLTGQKVELISLGNIRFESKVSEGLYNLVINDGNETISRLIHFK